MIRVNLLAVKPGTVVAAPRKKLIPAEHRSAAIGLAMLFVVAAGVGGWYWQIERERGVIDAAIISAETEIMRLRDAAALVAKVSARKADLVERIALIERLRSTEKGPVDLLMGVSRSLPEGLWLLGLNQKGPLVQLEGRAMSNDPISDFVRQMQDSGLFKLPVDIVSTVSEPFEDTTVIRFTIKAETLPLVADAPPTSKGTPTPPAAPGTH